MFVQRCSLFSNFQHLSFDEILLPVLKLGHLPLITSLIEPKVDMVEISAADVEAALCCLACGDFIGALVV